MKCVGKLLLERVTLSLPVRGAWIEMPRCAVPSVRQSSLPVRGAWIEIRYPSRERSNRWRRSPCGERGLKSTIHGVSDKQVGRSPCGERGLKYKAVSIYRQRNASLPVRGAWIEIPFAQNVGQNYIASLPVRGAWIEMSPPLLKSLISTWSLPVRGAWIEIMI